MIAARIVVGWLSWLMVATGIYAFIWSASGAEFPILPAAVYFWLADRLAIAGPESLASLDGWSASAVAVLFLHAAGLVIYRLAIALRCEPARRWMRQASAASRWVGWMSWMIVATVAVAACLDVVVPTASSRLAARIGSFAILAFTGLIVLGLHVIWWTGVRARHRAPGT